MSQSIYNPLNLNNPVPVDFDDLSDHEPFNDCSGEMGAHYGKTHSPETKKLIKTLMSGKGNPRYGVTVSKETRKKISEAKKGIKQSAEHIEKRQRTRVSKVRGMKYQKKPLSIDKSISF